MILITNASKLLSLALVAGLFAGCAATRPISDVALGAGGAYLGHELSNGDPLATAVGAAGGVIVSETLHDAAWNFAGKPVPRSPQQCLRPAPRKNSPKSACNRADGAENAVQ